MKRYTLILLLTCLCFSLFAIQPPKREVRAVWLATVYGLDWPHRPASSPDGQKAQREALCERLDRLQEANFNMVFFQVRLRGYVAYRSQIEPISSLFTGVCGRMPDYDPLAFAVEECHKRGMECHAWFVTFPLGTDKQVRELGKRSAVKRHPKLVKKHRGEWFLDPGQPGTADYVLSLVREIVERYDIDGIHFDYIRYPEAAKSFPDKASYRQYGKKTKQETWRRENINRLVARVYDYVKRVKPWVQVSSSPLGKYNRIPQVPNAGWTAFESVYQDPAEWLRRGKQDMIVPMMYYKHRNFFPFVDNWVENRHGRLVVPGLGAYRLLPEEGDWTLNDLTDQIDYSRYFGGAGAFLRGEAGFVEEVAGGALGDVQVTIVKGHAGGGKQVVAGRLGAQRDQRQHQEEQQKRGTAAKRAAEPAEQKPSGQAEDEGGAGGAEGRGAADGFATVHIPRPARRRRPPPFSPNCAHGVPSPVGP